MKNILKNEASVEYKIIRSRRKTISLQVKKDLSVIVRAPLRTPKKYIDEFVNAHSNWIDKAKNRIAAKNEAYPPIDDEEIKAIKAQAKEYIPKRVEYFSNIMKLYPTAVKINKAEKRFGSCSSKNSLNFSCMLMRYPKEAIDYVVVHELAHIRHKNHGSDFYVLVERVLPDWRERVKMLKG